METPITEALNFITNFQQKDIINWDQTMTDDTLIAPNMNELKRSWWSQFQVTQSWRNNDKLKVNDISDLASEAQKVMIHFGELLTHVNEWNLLVNKPTLYSQVRKFCLIEAKQGFLVRIQSLLEEIKELLLLPSLGSLPGTKNLLSSQRSALEKEHRNFTIYVKHSEEYEMIRWQLTKEVFKIQLYLASAASTFLSETILLENDEENNFFTQHKYQIQEKLFPNRQLIIETSSSKFVFLLDFLETLPHFNEIVNRYFSKPTLIVSVDTPSVLI